MNVEQLVERELIGGTEILPENPPQYYSVYHKYYMTFPGIEPGHKPLFSCIFHLKQRL
jgi:hypothetical protein